MRKSHAGLVLATMLIGAAAAPAWATTADAPSAPAAGAGLIPADVERQDTDTVERILKIKADNPFQLVREHLGELEAVCGRTPKEVRFRVLDRDGKLVMRGLSAADASQVSTALAAAWKARGETPREIVLVKDPYPTACLWVGAYYNEVGRPDLALENLLRGLAAYPDDLSLTTEAGAALISQRKFAEALAIYDRNLAGDRRYVTRQDEARLYRARGYALTELGRLDESEAAYKRSLELEPNHAGALHELNYIAHLRTGSSPTKGGLVTSAKAKDGELPK
jgi:tetratricopeptide (TPR) repeat protein